MSDNEKLNIEAVRNVIESSYRGIYKRIDENRELLELLQQQAPAFLEKHFWIEGWLQGQDGFLTDLLRVVPIVNPHSHREPAYPRPWPGKNRSK